MESWQNEIVGTGIYHSKDAVKNLKIKVTLQKFTSLSAVLDIYQAEEIDPVDYKDDGIEVEQYIFNWQEKIYSRAEITKYSQPLPPDAVVTDDYKEHVEKVKKLIDPKNRPTKRLYSLVNKDDLASLENKERLSTSVYEEKIRADEMKLRQRRGASGTMIEEQSFSIPTATVASYRPRKEGHRSLLSSKQVMYIMVDQSYTEENKPNTAAPPGTAPGVPAVPATTATPAKANKNAPPVVDFVKQICKITIDENGVLTITPDFSTGKRPYTFRSDVDRANYRFTIENASAGLSESQRTGQMKLLENLYDQRARRIQNQVGNEFDMPDSNEFRLFIYGEILSAKYFEFDHLFVRWLVEPPLDWDILNPDQMLYGTTPNCASKVEDRDDVTYFAHPFEISLTHRKPFGMQVENDDSIKWPQILFQIMSHDRLDCVRNEGYGYVTIPVTPGCHTLQVNCWRPSGDSIVDQMRRFFIGGARELDNLDYVSVPLTHQSTVLSRYGFKTASSGVLTIRLNVIMQSESFRTDRIMKNRAKNSVRHRIETSATGSHEVIEAFRRTYRRMETLRGELRKRMPNF